MTAGSQRMKSAGLGAQLSPMQMWEYWLQLMIHLLPLRHCGCAAAHMMQSGELAFK